MTQLEKDIEQKLIDMVQDYGGLCLKWVCPGWSGVPDRIILLPGGRVIFAETKRPKGGKLSKLQQWWLDRLRNMGFSVHVVWNEQDVENVERAIRCMLTGGPDPHKPLTRELGEPEYAFVHRVAEALQDNKLTANAARASIGLPPIEKETTT